MTYSVSLLLNKILVDHRSFSGWGKIAMIKVVNDTSGALERRLHFKKGKRESENQS